MIIAFTAINTQAEIQPFMCQLGSLEASLDVVGLIASQGNQLLDIVLIDGESTTPLPVDAFDGHSLSRPIRQLESQWKLLLSKPLNYRQRVIILSDRIVKRSCNNIVKFKQAVYLTEQRLQRIDEEITDEPHRTVILSQVRKTLERFQSNLAVEEDTLQKYTDIVLG